ncbi:hypothetical protein [Virgibacillus salexigens]|uniref:Uncharacterized protein n=1 Tax=Virgibacillus massiliensis TaxID=1462526 RepID=A0A024QH20_9BACI|nr:hypothetical protein [Virgibacillus massiliensis]CDQ41863.1 hypothetical protein BN990_04242 [Virgibacillus massiliensis]
MTNISPMNDLLIGHLYHSPIWKELLENKKIHFDFRLTHMYVYKRSNHSLYIAEFHNAFTYFGEYTKETILKFQQRDPLDHLPITYEELCHSHGFYKLAETNDYAAFSNDSLSDYPSDLYIFEIVDVREYRFYTKDISPTCIQEFLDFDINLNKLSNIK